MSLAFMSCIGLSGVIFRPAAIDEVIVGLILMPFGLFSIAGAYFDWNWFMRSRRARLFVLLFGRDGARVIYGLLGLVVIFIGLLIVIGLIDPAAKS